MENFNLLPNRMSDTPHFHAVIELKQRNSRWFYGYHVVLKEYFRRSPLSAVSQGEVSKKIALIFALNKISYISPGDLHELDDAAIAGALREEARRRLIEVAHDALVNERALIMADESCRIALAAVLPKNLISSLKVEELYHFDRQPKKGECQLSLF